MTTSQLEQLIGPNGNFAPAEFGDYSRLEPEAARQLIGWRGWHGYPTFISRGAEDRGNPDNTHQRGEAFDVIVYTQWKRSQPRPLEIWNLATTWPWMGVGIYFDWQHDGKLRCGLHLDVHLHQPRRPLRWIRVGGLYYYQSVRDGEFYERGGEKVSLGEQMSKFIIHTRRN